MEDNSHSKQDATSATPTVAPTYELPIWWRLGDIPYITLILAAFAADFGLYIGGFGASAGISSLFLTGAILLLRKDYGIGMVTFLACLAIVNCIALIVSGNIFNYICSFCIPFIVQALPNRLTIVPKRHFCTWWDFWKAHHKLLAGMGKRWIMENFRRIVRWAIPIILGIACFVSFLYIFAQGNPLVQKVWDLLFDLWKHFIRFLHISWDLPCHIFFWYIGACFFGLFTLRLGKSEFVEKFKKKFRSTTRGLFESGPARVAKRITNAVVAYVGDTIRPYLPICSLIGANLAFFIASFTDIVYLWFGNAPDGISQEQYLHEGAASITWASILAATLLVYLFRKNGKARSVKICKYFGFALIFQTALLAISVYMRLRYQVIGGGFTVRRIIAAETMLLGLAGLVILLFYMACSGSFVKYAKICIGTMVIMLMSFGICRPAKLAADLNLHYMPAHPEWVFTNKDFAIGRFSVKANLRFAYYVYLRYPSQEMRKSIIKAATALVEWESDCSWTSWTLQKSQDIEVAKKIIFMSRHGFF